MQPGTSTNPRPEMMVVRREMERLGRSRVDRDRLVRHYDNLASLSDKLRRLGMPEDDVAVHVLGIFGEFERIATHTMTAPLGLMHTERRPVSDA